MYVHAIYSTKHRERRLTPNVCKEFYPYQATVMKNLDCPAIQIGGTDDHIHMLFVLSKDLAIKKCIEEFKKPTSIWLKTKGKNLEDFYWQSGYGAFSVSQSNVERVRRYILNQEAHHRKVDFQTEFREFLKRYRVPYDERYVWD